MLAISPTVRVSIPKNCTIPSTINIAAKEEGMALVNLGKKWIINMVKAIKPIMTYKYEPSIQFKAPEASTALNCPNCAKNITIAKPLTKPSITG